MNKTDTSKAKSKSNSKSKNDLINCIAEKSQISHAKAGEAVAQVFSGLSAMLNNLESELRITSFGTFQALVSPEREGVNPKNRQKITIPKSVKIKFKPSPKLKSDISHINGINTKS